MKMKITPPSLYNVGINYTIVLLIAIHNLVCVDFMTYHLLAVLLVVPKKYIKLASRCIPGTVG